jgi:hypothetical protein
MRARIGAGVALLVLLAAIPACGGDTGPAPDVRVECRLTPEPPKVGPATVDLRLSDAAGAPIGGAKVRIEGNMNHAGMVPSIAEASELEPGSYQGTLEFTMGGAWFLLLEIELADGGKVEKTIDVPTVEGR